MNFGKEFIVRSVMRKLILLCPWSRDSKVHNGVVSIEDSFAAIDNRLGHLIESIRIMMTQKRLLDRVKSISARCRSIN